MRFLSGGTMAHRPLFLFLLFLFLVTAAVSADDPTTDDKNNAPTVANKATDGEPTQTNLPVGPTTTNDATATDAKTTDPPSTTIDDSTTASTASTDPTTASTSSDSTTSTMDMTTTDTTSMTTTSSTSTSSTDSTTTSTTSSTTSTSSDSLIPIVTVPPTADAPYMQKSSTPEGTVFIAVGAALGVIGLSVLAWRALVAWSVNRSVKRAAVIHSSETKGLLRSRKKKRRSYSRGGVPSPMSVDRLGKSARHSHTTTKVPRSNSGLFFSPTAGAGGIRGSGNRGSNYLPAGYYAAGSAAAGGGAGAAAASTFTGLGPQSQGYTRTRSGPSPPSSPILPSSSVHDVSYNSRQSQSLAGASTSSLNLASPSQVRAPSAYLEDLFESHAPPSDLSHR